MQKQRRLVKRTMKERERLTIEEFDALLPQSPEAKRRLRERVEACYASVKQRKRL